MLLTASQFTWKKSDCKSGEILSRLEPETRVIVLREVRGQVLADGRYRMHRGGGLLHSLGPGLRTHQDMRRNPWGTPNSRALATHRSASDCAIGLKVSKSIINLTWFNLVGVLVLFISVTPWLLPPNEMNCAMRHFLHPLSMVLCFSILLVKAMQLRYDQ